MSSATTHATLTIIKNFLPPWEIDSTPEGRRLTGKNFERSGSIFVSHLNKSRIAMNYYNC